MDHNVMQAQWSLLCKRLQNLNHPVTLQNRGQWLMEYNSVADKMMKLAQEKTNVPSN